MCRLEGCPHEVLYKTVDNGRNSEGGYANIDPLERRASTIRDRNGNPLQGRGSPAGGVPGGYPDGGRDSRQHRYSMSQAAASTVASPFCFARSSPFFLLFFFLHLRFVKSQDVCDMNFLSILTNICH